MWLSAIKLAVCKRVAKYMLTSQKTKMAMSEAQLMHADRMAKGEEVFRENC